MVMTCKLNDHNQLSRAFPPVPEFLPPTHTFLRIRILIWSPAAWYETEAHDLGGRGRKEVLKRPKGGPPQGQPQRGDLSLGSLLASSCWELPRSLSWLG